MTDQTPELYPAVVCAHPGRPAPTPGAPAWTCPACPAVFWTVTVTTPSEPVFITAPPSLNDARCPNDIDTGHPPHLWTCSLGHRGDVLTVTCDGGPLHPATPKTPED